MEEKREKSIFRLLPLCACQLEKFALNKGRDLFVANTFIVSAFKVPMK